jgi:hypothetical protein
MAPAEAMNAIKARRFAALTNLASNLKTFLRIAAQQPEVAALTRSMTQEPAVVAEVLQRALALSAVRTEGEHESKADAALATYQWLLSNHRRDLAQTVTGSIGEWRKFFWLRKLADELRLVAGSANGDGKEGVKERTGAAAEGVEALPRNP